MTKAELAPYLNAVTNEDDTLLVCITDNAAYIGDLSPTCDAETFVLTYQDVSFELTFAQVVQAQLLKV
ncbi:hypothetical protein [Streptococcus ruminantium]|uniref:hypothetical protein n=1 Tax=Streptococcus ruminantium TaxID=1917441 RepID=UPI0012DF4CDA|nr:hypothetical protein [Streptococcus ruminantium]